MSVSNLTLMCDRADDTEFIAAHALALTSADFFAVASALALLGVNGSVDIEGAVAVSSATGWPTWPELGPIMGTGMTLALRSQTGRGSIQFSMNADRLVIPLGSILLENLLLIRNVPTDVSQQLPRYASLRLYGGLDQPW